MTEERSTTLDPVLSLLRILGFVYRLFAILCLLFTVAVVSALPDLYLYITKPVTSVFHSGPPPTPPSPIEVWTRYLADLVTLSIPLHIGITATVLFWMLSDSLLKTRRYYFCVLLNSLVSLTFPVGLILGLIFDDLVGLAVVTILGLVSLFLLLNSETRRYFAQSGLGQQL